MRPGVVGREHLVLQLPEVGPAEHQVRGLGMVSAGAVGSRAGLGHPLVTRGDFRLAVPAVRITDTRCAFDGLGHGLSSVLSFTGRNLLDTLRPCGRDTRSAKPIRTITIRQHTDWSICLDQVPEAAFAGGRSERT